MNTILIRPEQKGDDAAVAALVEEAFRGQDFSDHREHFLVDRLKQSKEFAFALVAEKQGEIVGYILFSKLSFNERTSTQCLSLAPVAVKPAYQKQGIGIQLIEKAHQYAKEQGYGAVILLGHPSYYPRFGYKPLDAFGLKLPFEAPADCCMALELSSNALQDTQGTAIYASAFFE